MVRELEITLNHRPLICSFFLHRKGSDVPAITLMVKSVSVMGGRYFCVESVYMYRVYDYELAFIMMNYGVVVFLLVRGFVGCLT